MAREMNLIARQQGRHLHFSAEACGRTFPDVIIILEWKLVNPLVFITMPLGIRLTMEAFYELNRLRKSHGLEEIPLTPKET